MQSARMTHIRVGHPGEVRERGRSSLTALETVISVWLT